MSKTSRLENHPHVFLPRHIQELIGISGRQLRYWKNTGFFVPRQVKKQLRYNFEDFCLLTCVKNMRSHGVSVQQMRAAQVPSLMFQYRKIREGGTAVRNIGFVLVSHQPVLFTGRLYLGELKELTAPIHFDQLWEAVREIRVQTRLDTLESTAI